MERDPVGFLAELVVGNDGVFREFDPHRWCVLTVRIADDAPGLNTAYTAGGILSLTDAGLNFNVGADGVLRLEFFESFDDTAVSPDGVWNSGSLTFQSAAPVPEPSSYGLMALGAFGMFAAARRRKI